MFVRGRIDRRRPLLGGVAQGGDQFGPRRGSLCRVAGQQLVDDDHELGGQRGAQPCEVGGVPLQAGERGVGVGLTEERDAAREALVQHESE